MWLFASVITIFPIDEYFGFILFFLFLLGFCFASRTRNRFTRNNKRKVLDIMIGQFECRTTKTKKTKKPAAAYSQRHWKKWRICSPHKSDYTFLQRDQRVVKGALSGNKMLIKKNSTNYVLHLCSFCLSSTISLLINLKKKWTFTLDTRRVVCVFMCEHKHEQTDRIWLCAFRFVVHSMLHIKKIIKIEIDFVIMVIPFGIYLVSLKWKIWCNELKMSVKR